MGRYQQEYHQSLTEPDQYWGGAATLIDWYTEPTVVLDRSDPPFYRWFTGGVLNTCFNAVDRHVRDGRAGQPALIYDSPVTGSQRVMTYRELLEEVARFAGVLTGRGVRAGERVVIYMPMVPEAVVAMLACARIGAVHSVVFGGFAAAELATRIEDAAPVAIVTASCGIETSRVVEYKPIVDRAIGLSAHKPRWCVVLQRPQARALLAAGRDLDWAEVINVAGHRLSTGEMEEVLASHPAVAECAVIGVSDAIKGQVPRAFVVLKAGAGADPDALRAELVELVRDQIGPVAALRQVDVVPALPKTRSGKILRKTMRGIAEGRDEPVPSTIDDPAALDALRPLLYGS